MRERVIGLAVAWAALAARTAAIHGRGAWTVDDAYITFRYAERWAAGLGPTFNDGEWVEGYTSPLWLAVLTVAHLGGADTEWVARALGLVAAAAIPLVLAWLPVEGTSEPWSDRAAGIAAALAGTSGVITGWAGGGLEVAPSALLALGTWLFAARRAWALAAVTALAAALCRPELALVGAVLVADRVRAGDRRVAAGIAVALAVGLGAHEAWRLHTYGWPLPNTYYAKVGATADQVRRGVAYLGGFGLSSLGLCLAALTGARAGGWRAMGAWAALHAGFVVAVGGDGLPAWRFFAPVIPALAVWAGIGLARLEARGAVACAGAVVVWALAAVRLDPETARLGSEPVSRNGREVGAWLRERYPPDTLIATNTAGSVPYFSGLRTIDMLGLCDAHIAHAAVEGMGTRKAGHEKADGAYVLSRAPDIVLFGAARGRAEPFFPSDRALWAQPAFRQRYAIQRRKLPSGAPIVMWVRRDSPAAAVIPTGGGEDHP